MHSARMKRTGTLEGIRPWRGGVCSIDGCDREHDSRGLCKLHARRLRHNGDPMVVRHGKPGSGAEHPNWAGDEVSYEGLHGRIRSVRGSASLYPCVDCGLDAYDWSYDHRSPDEIHSPDGVYCLDLAHYEPRCRRCHIAFDAA